MDYSCVQGLTSLVESLCFDVCLRMLVVLIYTFLFCFCCFFFFLRALTRTQCFLNMWYMLDSFPTYERQTQYIFNVGQYSAQVYLWVLALVRIPAAQYDYCRAAML